MIVTATELRDVKLVKPDRHGDERGWFAEIHNADRYAAAGIPASFVQDNISYSRKGVLRGLHYQTGVHAQGKLVQVLGGEIFDVAVDIRPESDQFGLWTARVLTSGAGEQMWIPQGFAHGFLVVSETALVLYKCTAAYEPKAERSIRWNDPAIGIDWPAQPVELSAKDADAPSLTHR